MFKFISKLGDRYMFLKCNPIWKIIRPYYNYIKFAYSDFEKPNESSVNFYNQNIERVDNVANMLADEQSKKIYLDSVVMRI